MISTNRMAHRRVNGETIAVGRTTEVAPPTGYPVRILAVYRQCTKKDGAARRQESTGAGHEVTARPCPLGGLACGKGQVGGLV
jgi:hypothetical protein